uniref:Uncharacterized protein n=1 Tax=Anguilla anguilla TaxID=7936 RepID=A0A0E9V6C9_ANGAN
MIHLSGLIRQNPLLVTDLKSSSYPFIQN